MDESSLGEMDRRFCSTTSSKRASGTSGKHIIGRSTTCDARHNASLFPRRRVFLIRHSVCFKNEAARADGLTGAPLESRKVHDGACH
jgi:hypothetical protein